MYFYKAPDTVRGFVMERPGQPPIHAFLCTLLVSFDHTNPLYVKRFFGTIYPAIAWTLLIQIGLCLPGSAVAPPKWWHIPHYDKYAHIILFAGLASLWCYYFFCKGFSTERLKKVFLWVFLAAAANGILLEFVQLYFIPGRSFDFGDIVADLAGAGLAYALCNNKLLKISPG